MSYDTRDFLFYHFLVQTSASSLQAPLMRELPPDLHANKLCSLPLPDVATECHSVLTFASLSVQHRHPTPASEHPRDGLARPHETLTCVPMENSVSHYGVLVLTFCVF